jgi:hypothetical protein
MYSLTYEEHRTLTIEITPQSKHSYVTIFNMIDDFSKISVTHSYQDFRSKFIQSKWYYYSYEHYCMLSTNINIFTNMVKPSTNIEPMYISKRMFDIIYKDYPEYFVNSNVRKWTQPDTKTTYISLSLTYSPSLKTSKHEQYQIMSDLMFLPKPVILSNP